MLNPKQAMLNSFQFQSFLQSAKSFAASGDEGDKTAEMMEGM
jgi:hypothetical protein